MALDHINELVTVSESKNYRDKPVQVSSFRKTIIIHTASVIEALLLWKLKLVCNARRIELTDDWKYFEIKTIYMINESKEAVAGLRKREQKDVNRLDFLRITDLCRKYKIIKSKKLREDIDKVRKLRNRMHIGGLSEIEKEYQKSDLEFCFDVVRKTKRQMSN
jgi:hypothetical protein